MTVTSTGARASANAASMPPKPAPTMTTLGRCCDIGFSLACVEASGHLRIGSALGYPLTRMPCQHWRSPLAIRAVSGPARRPMPTHNLLLLAGDGIGPEVMAEVKRLIAFMNAHGMGTFESEEGLVGGCAYDAHGVANAGCT